jgi:hypothetical protein
MSTTTVFEKLGSIPPKIIYTLVIIVICAMIITKPLMPLPVDEETYLFYDYVDDLPDGAVLNYNLGISGGAWGEDQALAEALAHHVFQLPIKVIWTSIGAEDVAFQIRHIQGMAEKYPSKVYGEDYVILGWMPDSATAFAAYFSDIRTAFTTDYFGTPIDTLSIMDGINTALDLDMFIQGRAGTHRNEMVVKQLVVPYGTTYLLWDAIFNIPAQQPYRNAGQIKALLGAARAGPQYEVLTGIPGAGVIMADMVSGAHTLILIFILLGNISYIAKRGQTQ